MAGNLPQSPTTSKMIMLKSKDGVEFVVPEILAQQFEKIRHKIEEHPEVTILLPDVKSMILVKVIEYCKKHLAEGITDEDLERWDRDFLAVEQSIISELMDAAFYLGIHKLLDAIVDQI